MRLWRVFPWNPRARPGQRFAPDHLPRQSGQGRFDLPVASGASARYLAETRDHAVAEKIQNLRNRTLADDFLVEWGHRLALCPVTLDTGAAVADFCDPAVLATHGIRPDTLAYRDRAVTQGVAARLHRDEDVAGFRWWSSLFGEWHTVVLFSDRLRPGDLTFGEPEALALDHPAVVAAAEMLALELG